MNRQQTALAEILEKYGTTDRKGRKVACIAVHRISEYNLTSETVGTVTNLPYAFDDSDNLKYSVRKVDEIINLQIWS